jgi:hypothetical protein
LDESKIVLWISRHGPTPDMDVSLTEIMGDHQIVRHSKEIGRAKSLSTLLDIHQPDRVVATLPIDMQELLTDELFKRGMHPLLRPVYHHRRTAGEFVFRGFEEVLEVRVRTRPATKELP